jgi:PKHD-type hydroxylase
MLIVIANLLDGHDLAAVRQAIAAGGRFEDGSHTAGWHARQVKNNEQAAPSPDIAAVTALVERALVANEVFQAAARPKSFVKLMVSRYRAGMQYGTHVDDAIMGGRRADLSFTLFLSDEGEYQGGALMIEDGLEERPVRLAAGDAIVYPATSLHRVAPVTAGERLCVVGWVTSLVRDAGQREILFDLEVALKAVFARDGKTDLFDRLAKTRSNLLRMWADD